MSNAVPGPIPFEKALAELDSIVRTLEDGSTTLETSLERYERGVTLLKHCHDTLRQAEQRISIIAGIDGEGQVQLKQFDHRSSAADGEPGRKRTPAPKPKPNEDGLY